MNLKLHSEENLYFQKDYILMRLLLKVIPGIGPECDCYTRLQVIGLFILFITYFPTKY